MKTIAAEFDAKCADKVVQIIANGADQLKLSQTDIAWGVRMLWTLGQVAPITNAAQHDAYAEQVAGILASAGAPMSRDAIGEFVRTPDGALAAALMSRMSEWTKRGH